MMIPTVIALALVIGTRGEGEVREGTESSGTDSAATARERLSDVDEATLSELFRWSIENSDLERLGEMAREASGDGEGSGGKGTFAERAEAALARARGRGGEKTEAIDDGGRKIEKVFPKKPMTKEEIDKKRADVREALDVIKSGPSTHAYARECGAVAAAKNETKERRLAALSILYDLVAPIDVANDLDKLGVAEALVSALGDPDEDVASGAASALASAASNNVMVQGIIYDRGGVDLLLKLVSSPSTPGKTRHKSLWVLGMCLRTHEPSREKFFASGGARVLADVLSDDTPAKMRTRGMALLGDLLHIDGVAEEVFRDETVGKRLIADVVARAADARASADVVEKSLICLIAARDRGFGVAVDVINSSSARFTSIAERFASEEDEYGSEVARLARTLARSARPSRRADEL